MRSYRIFCLGAVLALPQLALSELPFPIPTLAQIDGAVDFCAQAKPETAQKYRDFGKLVLKDVPKKDVERARNSEQYRQALLSVKNELAKLNREDAVKTCSDFLKSN